MGLLTEATPLLIPRQSAIQSDIFSLQSHAQHTVCSQDITFVALPDFVAGFWNFAQS